jgi:hypothetical protein
MRKTSLCLMALLGMVLSQVAFAVSTNPVMPTVAQVQALLDVTAGDSGNTQLSTIDSITNIARGIELAATFRVGIGTDDPFDPNYGQNFARISLKADAPALDWSAFDGFKLTITHSTGDAFVQPFLVTGASFLFHEPSGGGIGLGSTSPTDIVLDFSNVRIFDPFTDPIALANPESIQAYGIQFITNGVTLGNPVSATIRIESIPEPATMSLIGLCVAALGLRRR